MKKKCVAVLALFVSVLFINPALASVVAPATVPAESAEPAMANALDEFNSLTKKERKGRLKEVKKLVKEYKANKRDGLADDDNTILYAIIAVLLPPLAVYLKRETIDTSFWICFLLTLLFWLPGVIFALLIVFDVLGKKDV
jgi:uncharacterized membrane protein YqaE (UPF0057 family)